MSGPSSEPVPTMDYASSDAVPRWYWSDRIFCCLPGVATFVVLYQWLVVLRWSDRVFVFPGTPAEVLDRQRYDLFGIGLPAIAHLIVLCVALTFPGFSGVRARWLRRAIIAACFAIVAIGIALLRRAVVEILD